MHDMHSRLIKKKTFEITYLIFTYFALVIINNQSKN